MKCPYGNCHLATLMGENYFYADRSDHIPENYYDAAKANQFTKLFREALSKYCAQSACPTGVAVAPWSRSLRLLGALWRAKC